MKICKLKKKIIGKKINDDLKNTLKKGQMSSF